MPAYIATTLIISKHSSFEFKNTVIGVASSGGAIGIVLFPPIADFLQDIYGWRAAMLIIGAINANMIACLWRSHVFCYNLSCIESV